MSCGPPSARAELILRVPFPGTSTQESRGKPRTVPAPVRGSTARRWRESPLVLRMSWPGRASEPMARTKTRSWGTGTELWKAMAGPWGLPSGKPSGGGATGADAAVTGGDVSVVVVVAGSGGMVGAGRADDVLVE